MEDFDFKQVIESVKLRISIEDAVRERVPELKRAGQLFTACCPFHDEKTPSFKVDPRRGTWTCYGACGTGGDVLSFVQRFDGLGFSDALDSLAEQAGVDMPKGWKGKRAQQSARYEKLYDALERAEKFYARSLAGASGAAARTYLEERGIDKLTSETFGVGLSPMSGNPLLDVGQKEGGELLSALVDSGLVRNGDERSYDFFHGRLMIPIRDSRGRTVGFGGRRLDDRADSPKYVNTAETPVFHKGRLIYGLDRATKAIRTTRHMILVEGYTDVMAAHQVGFAHVAAVLGTSTTEDHAALVRRTGARRVTLVFDGDEAGRRATFRALEGLLTQPMDLDVLRLPADQDPCDLFLGEGAAAFEKRLEACQGWLEFALDGLTDLSGSKLSDGVDQVLRLVQRLPKPVYRESCLVRISEALELSVDAIRLQARDLVGRRRAVSANQEPKPKRGALIETPAPDSPARDPQNRGSEPLTAPRNNFRGITNTEGAPPDGITTSDRPSRAPNRDPNTFSPHAPNQSESPSEGSSRPLEPAGGELHAHREADELVPESPQAIADRRRELRAYSDLAGAVLIDNSLIPAVSECFADCPNPKMAEILTAILDLYENGSEDLEIDAPRVMDALGSHPAREWIVPIEERARSGESTRLVAEGAVEFLTKLKTRRSIDQHRHQFAQAGDEASRSSALMEIWNESRRLKVPISKSDRLGTTPQS